MHGPEQEVPSALSFPSEILELIRAAFRKRREGEVWGPESFFPLFPVVNCLCRQRGWKMRMKGARLGKAAAQDLTWTAELGQQPQVGVVAWEWLSGAALWHFSNSLASRNCFC